jgi:hypothetical protein
LCTGVLSGEIWWDVLSCHALWTARLDFIVHQLGNLLTQSLAFIKYIDIFVPSPRLIQEDLVLAAKIRAVALTIAC